jgi:hypothetical protein
MTIRSGNTPIQSTTDNNCSQSGDERALKGSGDDDHPAFARQLSAKCKAQAKGVPKLKTSTQLHPEVLFPLIDALDAFVGGSPTR